MAAQLPGKARAELGDSIAPDSAAQPVAADEDGAPARDACASAAICAAPRSSHRERSGAGWLPPGARGEWAL